MATTDDLALLSHSEELAQNSGAVLIAVGTDHSFADPQPLAAVLRACEEVL